MAGSVDYVNECICGSLQHNAACVAYNDRKQMSNMQQQWQPQQLGGFQTGALGQYIPPSFSAEQLERMVAAAEKLADAFAFISNKYR